MLRTRKADGGPSGGGKNWQTKRGEKPRNCPRAQLEMPCLNEPANWIEHARSPHGSGMPGLRASR